MQIPVCRRHLRRPLSRSARRNRKQRQIQRHQNEKNYECDNNQYRWLDNRDEHARFQVRFLFVKLRDAPQHRRQSSRRLAHLDHVQCQRESCSCRPTPHATRHRPALSAQSLHGPRHQPARHRVRRRFQRRHQRRSTAQQRAERARELSHLEFDPDVSHHRHFQFDPITTRPPALVLDQKIQENRPRTMSPTAASIHLPYPMTSVIKN